MNTITIGYFPREPMAEGSSDNTDFIDFLETLTHHPKVKIIQYKGFSSCRCCDKPNGSREFVVELDEKYVIPEGYVHYLRDHKIAVDPNLIVLRDKLSQYLENHPGDN